MAFHKALTHSTHHSVTILDSFCTLFIFVPSKTRCDSILNYILKKNLNCKSSQSYPTQVLCFHSSISGFLLNIQAKLLKYFPDLWCKLNRQRNFEFYRINHLIIDYVIVDSTSPLSIHWGLTLFSVSGQSCSYRIIVHLSRVFEKQSKLLYSLLFDYFSIWFIDFGNI